MAGLAGGATTGGACGAESHGVRVHVDQAGSVRRLAEAVGEMVPHAHASRSVVVLCVGSDRSTGDALGPLVGTELSEKLASIGLTAAAGEAIGQCRAGQLGSIGGGEHVAVYGTLDEPVHAANLAEAWRELRGRHPDAFVLAVDACLGRSENVGSISVRPGPLLPGTGVNKRLPAVGDGHIVGVVNVGGFMEYFVLQNTRLSLVVRMARAVATGLWLAFAAREWGVDRRGVSCTTYSRDAGAVAGAWR